MTTKGRRLAAGEADGEGDAGVIAGDGGVGLVKGEGGGLDARVSGEHGGEDAVREFFNEGVALFFDDVAAERVDLGVVDGVGKVVAGGSVCDVHLEIEIEDEGLPQNGLGRQNAMVTVETQGFEMDGGEHGGGWVCGLIPRAECF